METDPDTLDHWIDDIDGEHQQRRSEKKPGPIESGFYPKNRPASVRLK